MPPPAFPGPGGPPPGPQGAPKKWLPPPSWTPGATGGPTFRQWLWLLAGWARITGMAHEERGIATAMSLGGRARDIGMDIPQSVLGRRDGLTILLQRLEGELGSELQDRQRQAGKAFDRYQRPKNLSASEYITTFERLYSEAVAHGLAMSRTLLSQKLLDKAMISENQELWILQQCGADYSQYEVIRRSLRRLPHLDSRHGADAGNWYGTDSDSMTSSHQSPQTAPYNPFAAHSLQRPAPDPPTYDNPTTYTQPIDQSTET
jgi:hypothetical protein